PTCPLFPYTTLFRSIGDGIDQPLPAHLATFHIECPRRAAAFPDLRLPAIVVSRNCEHIRHRGCDHHAAQSSNQKNAHHFSIPHRSEEHTSELQSRSD